MRIFITQFNNANSHVSIPVSNLFGRSMMFYVISRVGSGSSRRAGEWCRFCGAIARTRGSASATGQSKLPQTWSWSTHFWENHRQKPFNLELVPPDHESRWMCHASRCKCAINSGNSVARTFVFAASVRIADGVGVVLYTELMSYPIVSLLSILGLFISQSQWSQVCLYEGNKILEQYVDNKIYDKTISTYTISAPQTDHRKTIVRWSSAKELPGITR